ncbi:MAG TPA: hypothetical protein VIP98_09255 [Microlunatus sp.]
MDETWLARVLAGMRESRRSTVVVAYTYVSAIVTLLLLLGEVLALVLIMVNVRGTARALAGVGIGVLMVVLIMGTLYGMILPALNESLGIGLEQMQAVSLGVNSVFAVIAAVGVILIGLAVGRRARTTEVLPR